jgi:hypothetical protein
LISDRFITHGPPIILHTLFSDHSIIHASPGSSIPLLIDRPGDYSRTYTEPCFDSAQLCPDEPVSITVILDPSLCRREVN